MSCYTRHLGAFLPAEPSPGDKRALDAAIRSVLDMRDAHCPEVWAQVKVRRDHPAFADQVRAAMRGAR